MIHTQKHTWKFLWLKGEYWTAVDSFSRTTFSGKTEQEAYDKLFDWKRGGYYG